MKKERENFPLEPKEMIEFIFKRLMCGNGFIVRDNQIQLSKKIFDGIKNNNILICEAGVGTGKTYAYLVASIVYSLYKTGEKKSVSIISTSSIELQNAIIKNYVPVLSKILVDNKIIDKPLSAVLRKGKEHYFCILRFKRIMNYLKSSDKDIDKELLNKLIGLKIGEISIDLDEYKGLKNHIVQKINVPKGCNYSCPFYENCRYIELMKYVKSSTHDFQVCNHNYYIADAIKRYKGKTSLMPEHSLAIIDEVHKLMDAAIQIFEKRFSYEDVLIIVNVLKSKMKGNKAYLTVQKGYLDDLSLEAKKFYQGLLNQLKNIELEEDSSQIRIKLGAYERKILGNIILKLDKISLYCKADIEKNRQLELMIENLREVIEIFHGSVNIIYWLENPQSERLISICSIPTDMEKQLYKVLWKNRVPKILTSGTLSDDRGFNYFKSTSGIDMSYSNKLSEVSYSSPYDYKNNTLLYISENIPYPDKQSEEYISAIADEILRLIDASFGHAVVLFTAYSLLSKVYELTKTKIKYPLFKMDKSEKNIVDAYKRSKNGVLFATGSFWEGVDCPGDILSSLIIVNLPFPTPTPIYEHKKMQYEELKEFIKHIVFPEMLIKLKQGMGRLIRCETDTGVISILDYRVSLKGKYRKRVLQALNEYRITDSLDDVRRFFKKVKREEYFL